ncbi:MAG: primosomal protein N' [Anaerolineaceae bacterium]|nr:primosomal protein N' [Anaerolineaceae bacterium]
MKTTILLLTKSIKRNTLEQMFAELVINIEAPLEGTFHYHVPNDMRPKLRVGHLVEVEFGRRLAQGIILRFDDAAPIEDTKPIIALVDEKPVVFWWQLELAQWLSQTYLAPLNGCLRLMLPPGLTRWADVTVDINPYWDGKGIRTELQQQIIDILKERGDLRGRQLNKALRKLNDKSKKKIDWQTAVNQLHKRNILRKATVLDPPRIKPKQIRTAELIASDKRIQAVVPHLGRANKQADVLLYLLESDDPLPEETAVLTHTGADEKHLEQLVEDGRISRTPAQTTLLPTAQQPPAEHTDLFAQLPCPLPQLTINHSPLTINHLITSGHLETLEEPATLSLAIPPKQLLSHILDLRQATTYQSVLTLLARAAQPVSLTEIYAHTSAKISHLRKLAKLDLIRFGSEEVWRDPLADRDFVPAEPPMLTADQARVWGRIKMAMLGASEKVSGAQVSDDETNSFSPEHLKTLTPENASTFLLHGVTGSGKTEIYMRAIEYAINEGQQAIVLVPEIALTPQTVRRFAARFPGRVAILHSRLSDGERYDTWRRARQGLFDIVVGPRSALFTPLPNLGVIILDEEHDPSYKQTPPVPPPYYHTRETAVALSQIVGATVIMGSATPDIVTYHRAQSGRFQLLELQKRVMGHRQRLEGQAERLQLQNHYQHDGEDPDDALTIPLPPIQVVDLRQELRAGNRSIFSRALEKAITETLERGEQAILFLNRRGSATFVICRDCGYVATCPRCDMPLTYHRHSMQLVCHHCGRREPHQTECPQCQSKRIKFFGLGTEEVVDRVQQRWPKARITRWDRDTTAGRDTHENLLASFINQEADILVGTQMIAKGLDLPLVTLVGVISADVSLGLPDYRTGERAFQVLAQVAGRAGRGLLGGRVIIQTYKPEHYAIQAAAEHDFAAFYIDEIRFRTQHSLPPFRRMARLLYIDPVDERGKREAEALAKGLRLHIREKALAASEILGPVPPFFNRVDGRFRWQIIVRSPDPNRLLADFPIPPKWMVDIDPVSTL